MNKGFTLLEIVISMSILSAMLVVITMFGLDIFDFGVFLGENLTSQQETQLTMRVLVSETRSMSQSVNGSFPIESASQNSLTFFSDIDGDGLAERLRYFLDGTTFKRGVTKPSGNPLVYLPSEEEISEQVHSIYVSGGNIFTYFDQSYSGTGSALAYPVNIPAVKLIKINITVDPNPLDPSSRVNFTNAVNIRNL